MPAYANDLLPRSDKHLTTEQFIAEFVRLFDAMQRHMWKFERLQSYQEPDNTSFQAFARGDIEEAKRLISDNVARETEWFTRVGREDIAQVRVRAVEVPLTPYLNWEFLTYQVTARFGQRILVTDITNDPPSSQISKGSDFLIFDGRAVLAHDYDHAGLLQGAWLIEDPRMVQRYVEFFENARARSLPLGAFERLHNL